MTAYLKDLIEDPTFTEILVNGKIPVQWDGRESRCWGCEERIGWGTTKNGKKMPFDFDDENTAHWSTCPNEKELRK